MFQNEVALKFSTNVFNNFKTFRRSNWMVMEGWGWGRGGITAKKWTGLFFSGSSSS